MARVDTGQVVSRTLSAHESREVATLGVARIRATPDFYVDRLTDIVNFKRDEAVVQIGTFSNPPHLSDVAGLTLDAWDVDRLRECRVNDCGLQLSADAIDRLVATVDAMRAFVDADPGTERDELSGSLTGALGSSPMEPLPPNSPLPLQSGGEFGRGGRRRRACPDESR